MKRRLDILLVDRGVAETREEAQRLIGAGLVFSNDQRLEKAGHSFEESIPLDVRGGMPFVSRGGDKLEAAFRNLGLNVSGLTCLDIGASTGGFTDCLIQHGAARVYAVDVGYGQLHWKLRKNPQVVVLERVNARYLEKSMFPETPVFAVIDVSFISLTMILPAAIQILGSGAGLVTLVKPQFEAGRNQVGRGGVVRDEAVRQEVLARIRDFGCTKAGLEIGGECESPLKGPAGNVEFLIYWRKKS